MSDQAEEFNTPDRPPFWYDVEQPDPIDVLNYLIEINRDGQEGYRLAAEAVEDTDERRLFEELSQQRETFVRKLTGHVVRLGGRPEEDGLFEGILHRAWINIKTAVSDNRQAVITECRRGEKSAIKAYERALEGNLPRDIEQPVRKQLDQIRAASAQLEAMA